jgi:hypothetical protein
MSADAVWNLVYLGIALVWLALIWAFVRSQRRREHVPFYEADLRRRQTDAEVEQSKAIGWRRG